MSNWFAIIFFFLIPTQHIWAQWPAPYTAQQVQLLDSIVTQDVPPNAPGVASAIILQGNVVYEKVAGFADFADSSLITKHTRFNLASNGKQFTALAILTLIDDKKLSLKDDVRKYLPSFFPKIKSTISIENLLTHSSGIRDVYDLWSLQGITWWKNSFNNQDVLQLVQRQEHLNFTPGSDYLYSNTNYILLALIIEKITGRSFAEFTSDVFRKLNMPNTAFEQDHTTIRGPIARAYFNFNTWTTYKWIWNVCGDGNLFSTLADQIQWERLVQDKGVSTIKKELIHNSQRLLENTENRQYGYGLEFGNYKGLEYRFHEGATGAWKVTVLRFPTQQISIITLTNTGKSIPAMQSRQVADVVLNLEARRTPLITKPARIGKPVINDQLLGIYLAENDFSFQFEKRGDKFFLKRLGRNDVELEREGENIFHQKSDPAFKQEFNTNSKGEMEVTAYYTTHDPYTLTRANYDWSGMNYEALNGKYLNVETNVLLDIKHVTNKHYEVIIGSKDSSNGLLIAPNKMLVNQYSISFEKNKSGVATLLLNGNRIKQIQFNRVKK